MWLWDTSTDTACDRYNVGCNDWHVIDIDLSMNNLSWELRPSIWSFSGLINLLISNNNIWWTIPNEIWNLNNLIILNIWNNKLSGNIPVSISNMNNLEQLMLYGNQLNWIIPSEISNLTKLKTLWLHNNSLQWNIPKELWYITWLISIKIENNLLTWFIPYSIKLWNLWYFGYNWNLLSGIINDWTYTSQTIEWFLTLMDTQYISPINDGRDSEILAPDIILAWIKLAVPSETWLDIDKIYKTFSVWSNVTFLVPWTWEFEMQIKIHWF